MSHDVLDLVNDLWELPECSVGGPLHIITDDGNVRDSDLDFCETNLDGHSSVKDATPEDAARIRDVSRRILETLRPLTMAERLDALGLGDRPDLLEANRQATIPSQGVVRV